EKLPAALDQSARSQPIRQSSSQIAARLAAPRVSMLPAVRAVDVIVKPPAPVEVVVKPRAAVAPEMEGQDRGPKAARVVVATVQHLRESEVGISGSEVEMRVGPHPMVYFNLSVEAA